MAFSNQSRSLRNRIDISFWLYALSLCCLLPHRHAHAFSTRPFQLQQIDHIVLTFQEDVQPMMDFYTEILGCTIDSPDDIGRMNGKLTHLRAGPNTMIDLMKREEDDDSETSPSPAASSSAVDHFCLRIDPYDQEELEDYLQSKGIKIQSTGMRKGAGGVGPSIYIQDPVGNTIELKGPAVKQTGDDNRKEEEGAANLPEETTAPNHDSKVPVTPCTRICRYNADFFQGQVCIGCYREAFEIGTWASMSSTEKYMGLLDAMDRCSESSISLDGAISLEELKRQAAYWKNLSSEGKR